MSPFSGGGRKNLQPAAIFITYHYDQQMIVEYETEFHRRASNRELAAGEAWGVVNGPISPLPPHQPCSPPSSTACGAPLGPKSSNATCDWIALSGRGEVMLW